MPLYRYRCEAGHGFERMVPLARFDEAQSCECGQGAVRVICAPMVISDDIAPTIGADGRTHTSRQSLAAVNQGQFRPIERGESIETPPPPPVSEVERINDIKAAMADIDAGRPPQFV